MRVLYVLTVHSRGRQFTRCSQWGLKDSTLIKTQGYIDGKWIDAIGGERILVTSEYCNYALPTQGNVHGGVDAHAWAPADPATEEELGTIPEMGVEETKVAIAAAGKAFQTWGKTTAKVCFLQNAQDVLTELWVVLIASVPTRHPHEIL